MSYSPSLETFLLAPKFDSAEIMFSLNLKALSVWFNNPDHQWWTGTGDLEGHRVGLSSCLWKCLVPLAIITHCVSLESFLIKPTTVWFPSVKRIRGRQSEIQIWTSGVRATWLLLCAFSYCCMWLSELCIPVGSREHLSGIGSLCIMGSAIALKALLSHVANPYLLVVKPTLGN